jgi:hypothetical protein
MALFTTSAEQKVHQRLKALLDDGRRARKPYDIEGWLNQHPPHPAQAREQRARPGR